MLTLTPLQQEHKLTALLATVEQLKVHKGVADQARDQAILNERVRQVVH